MIDSRKPGWKTSGEDNEFNTRILKGEKSRNRNDSASRNLNRETNDIPDTEKPDLEAYLYGISRGDKTMLARAITLVESSSTQHQAEARELLKRIMPQAGRSVRIGISGIPGAGKSTFIEALGCHITDHGHKTAVLAIDPSSSLSGGSILADKTRMERLSRQENCFIRPSPTGGTLGGVAGKTRETILICEAAGYDVILVETVGSGQNEITVRGMVDFFMLLYIPGAGDELQAIKKGNLELADMILINKADGHNRRAAETSRDEFSVLTRTTSYSVPGWRTAVRTISALENRGIKETWNDIENFLEITRKNGFFNHRRREQLRYWLHEMIRDYIRHEFYNDERIKVNLPRLEEKVLIGDLPPAAALAELVNLYKDPNRKRV